MKKLKFLIILLVLLLTCPLLAGEIDLGADIYNRYVWRGTDFGNTPAIQPYISYTINGLEVGAWSSWSVTGAPGGNENDLYISYCYENFQLALTDYFFPAYTGDDEIDDFSENGAHTIELSGGYTISDFSLLFAINVLGNDPDNSKYIELSYECYQQEDISVTIFTGAGDFIYSRNNKFRPVNLGVNIAKGEYNAAYIINPDQRTSFLTFGVSL
jgi:hypothetical protein